MIKSVPGLFGSADLLTDFSLVVEDVEIVGFSRFDSAIGLDRRRMFTRN